MRRYISLITFLLLLALGSLGSLAAEAQTLKVSAPSLGVAIFRMIGSLASVVALIFAGAWFYRNMHRFRQPGAAQRKLHVVEARTLGARQALYVICFEQQRFLVGSSPQGLTLLTHLPDGAPQTEAERIVPVSFGEALMQALGRK